MLSFSTRFLLAHVHWFNFKNLSPAPGTVLGRKRCLAQCSTFRGSPPALLHMEAFQCLNIAACYYLHMVWPRGTLCTQIFLWNNRCCLRLLRFIHIYFAATKLGGEKTVNSQIPCKMPGTFEESIVKCFLLSSVLIIRTTSITGRPQWYMFRCFI